MSPIILAGAGIVILGVGLGLGYWFAHIRRTREAAKACEVQQELDEYRRHVTEHFSETAQHFQEIGQQYRSLYKHMALGAEALCDSAQSDGLLGFAAGDAPEIAVKTVDEPEDAPEVIRDYAAAEESEPTPVEIKAEEPVVSEPPTDAAATEEKKDKPAAEEVLAEQVSAATSINPDRTVH